MPANAMYCHACHHQWQGESDAINCPTCGSASTEIVREFPHRRITNRQLTEQQISPEDDPCQFHSQVGAAVPAAAASALAEPHPANSQPTSGDVDQEMSDAPAADEQAGNTANPANNDAGNAGAQSGHDHRPDFIFVLPPPMVTFVTRIQQPTHVPPPNTAGPAGPPIVTHFTMNFFPPFFRHPSPPAPAAPPSTGVNSPPAGAETPSQEQDAAGNPHHTAGQTPSLPFSWLDLLLGAMHPSNIALGDAVFSNEALDRIISQLREQSGPGGAPPASQAAIDKLEVKEVDEKMLGGETKSRCVICVDEMSVGDKASVLPCSHFFHGECVTPWLKQHNTCPVCRRSIEPEPIKPAKAAEFAHDVCPEDQHALASDPQGCS